MKYLYSGLEPLDCSSGYPNSAEQLGYLPARFVLTDAATRGTEWFTVSVYTPRFLDKVLTEKHWAELGRNMLVLPVLGEEAIDRVFNQHIASFEDCDSNEAFRRMSEMGEPEAYPWEAWGLPVSVERAVLACKGRPFTWKMRTLETEYYPHPDFQSLGLAIRVELTLEPNNGATPRVCEIVLCDPCWIGHELEGKEHVRSADFVIMHDVSLIVLREMLTVHLRKVKGKPVEVPTEEEMNLWKQASWAAVFSTPGPRPYI